MIQTINKQIKINEKQMDYKLISFIVPCIIKSWKHIKQIGKHGENPALYRNCIRECLHHINWLPQLIPFAKGWRHEDLESKRCLFEISIEPAIYRRIRVLVFVCLKRGTWIHYEVWGFKGKLFSIFKTRRNICNNTAWLFADAYRWAFKAAPARWSQSASRQN